MEPRPPQGRCRRAAPASPGCGPPATWCAAPTWSPPWPTAIASPPASTPTIGARRRQHERHDEGTQHGYRPHPVEDDPGARSWRSPPPSRQSARDFYTALIAQGQQAHPLAGGGTGAGGAAPLRPVRAPWPTRSDIAEQIKAEVATPGQRQPLLRLPSTCPIWATSPTTRPCCNTPWAASTLPWSTTATSPRRHRTGPDPGPVRVPRQRGDQAQGSNWRSSTTRSCTAAACNAKPGRRTPAAADRARRRRQRGLRHRTQWQ